MDGAGIIITSPQAQGLFSELQAKHMAPCYVYRLRKSEHTEGMRQGCGRAAVCTSALVCTFFVFMNSFQDLSNLIGMNMLRVARGCW